LRYNLLQIGDFARRSAVREGLGGRVLDRCLGPGGRGLIHSIGRSKPAPLNAWIERRFGVRGDGQVGPPPAGTAPGEPFRRDGF